MDTSSHSPTPANHLLLTYTDRNGQIEALAQFYGEGLANGELCILVTPEPAETIVTSLAQAGLDTRKAIRNNDLRIFNMVASYLPRGSFASNAMLMNVVNFIIEAKAKDYRGLRTAGDMAWLYDRPEYIDDAMRYENRVTQLRDICPEFTGLCMYPERDGSEAILEGARHSHPGVFALA